MAIIPGLPKIPFILIAGALWIAATRSKGRNETEVLELAAGEAAAAAPVSKDTPEAIASDMRVDPIRSEEHTSALQSLMRISYAVFCLKKKTPHDTNTNNKIS